MPLSSLSSLPSLAAAPALQECRCAVLGIVEGEEVIQLWPFLPKAFLPCPLEGTPPPFPSELPGLSPGRVLYPAPHTGQKWTESVELGPGPPPALQPQSEIPCPSAS